MVTNTIITGAILYQYGSRLFVPTFLRKDRLRDRGFQSPAGPFYPTHPTHPTHFHEEQDESRGAIARPQASSFSGFQFSAPLSPRRLLAGLSQRPPPTLPAEVARHRFPLSPGERNPLHDGRSSRQQGGLGRVAARGTTRCYDGNVRGVLPELEQIERDSRQNQQRHDRLREQE